MSNHVNSTGTGRASFRENLFSPFNLSIARLPLWFILSFGSNFLIKWKKSELIEVVCILKITPKSIFINQICDYFGLDDFGPLKAKDASCFSFICVTTLSLTQNLKNFVFSWNVHSQVLFFLPLPPQKHGFSLTTKYEFIKFFFVFIWKIGKLKTKSFHCGRHFPLPLPLLFPVSFHYLLHLKHWLADFFRFVNLWMTCSCKKNMNMKSFPCEILRAFPNGRKARKVEAGNVDKLRNILDLSWRKIDDNSCQICSVIYKHSQTLLFSTSKKLRFAWTWSIPALDWSTWRWEPSLAGDKLNRRWKTISRQLTL